MTMYCAIAENVHTFIPTGLVSPIGTLEECIDWGMEHAQTDDIGFTFEEIHEFPSLQVLSLFLDRKKFMDETIETVAILFQQNPMKEVRTWQRQN